MAEPNDVNVDELKRRARRRLVGAVVLALAAAVFVPMLLESDPKPLGEDVSVRIPPVDDGKFVNRLSDKGRIEPPRTAAKIEPPKAEPVVTESPKAEPPPGVAAPPSSTQEPPPKAASAAPAAKSSLNEAEQKVLGAPAKTASAPAPAPKAAPAPASSTAQAPAKTDGQPGFSVQLAAFADDKGANALSNKLKRAGYPAYTEPLTTSKGTLWRVRVGPYPSRDAAAVSRDKLKGEGYSGIVAPAS